jgi:hypothetical protein
MRARPIRTLPLSSRAHRRAHVSEPDVELLPIDAGLYPKDEAIIRLSTEEDTRLDGEAFRFNRGEATEPSNTLRALQTESMFASYNESGAPSYEDISRHDPGRHGV